MIAQLIVEQDGTVVGTYLDVRLLAMLASTMVPLLVNLVTKLNAPDGLKSVINIALTGLVTVLSLWINPSEQPVTLSLVANTFLFSLVTSFTAYKSVWKPTGISGTVAVATAKIGFGPEPSMETDSKGAEEADQLTDLTHGERDAAGLGDEIEDLGDPLDSDGDGIPDHLDVEDLDDLVAEAPEDVDDDFDPATPEDEEEVKA